MLKTTAAVTVFSLAALNPTALELESQTQVPDTRKEQWKEFWATKKEEYKFGEDSGLYDLKCTRVAQRRWFYAENFNCPAKDTEKK